MIVSRILERESGGVYSLIVNGKAGTCLSAGVLLLLALFPSGANGSATDDLACVEANRFLEAGVCINDRQQEFNRLIAAGYGRLVAKLGRPAANRIQIPYMRMRLMCGANTRCEYHWQISQLATYHQLVPAAQTSPSAISFFLPHQSLRERLRPGECALSTVAGVSCPKGEGEMCSGAFGRGLRIVLADDFQDLLVEEASAALNTRRGDPVLACKDPPSSLCAAHAPAGNHWTIMNYRTGDSWRMADTLAHCTTHSRSSGGH